ncbi:hypothetical protein K2X33_12840 [bacterium]|nr:hypothetical protein [bacterium]
MAITRRDWIKGSLAALGTFSGAKALGAICGITHAQGEGPYYPERDLNRDNDLTQILPGGASAKGQVLDLTGQVTNAQCRPIAGALVEIWQAAASGKYNHSQDPNPLPADPNFQYWGRTRTDANGNYRFRSIIPGHYPLDPRLTGIEPTGPGQYRPPHIHFKVHAPGFQSLTTQMYFDPKSYDDADLAKTVSDLNRWENVDPTLTVLFADTGGIRVGSFDITLRQTP